MVPISGDYLRIRNSATAPTDVAGLSTIKTNAAGVPIFRTAAGVEYAVNPSGPNTITVGALGDYTTIAAAIAAAATRTPSATNRVTILVYPGVYTGRNSLLDYVDLIGVNRQACIIKDDMENEILNVLGSCEVANLTFENTHAAVRSGTVSVGGNYYLGLPLSSGKTIKVTNCTFISAGKDNYVTLGDNNIETRDCTMISAGIDQISLGVPSGATHRYWNCDVITSMSTAKVLWVAGAGTAAFNGCHFTTTGDNGIVNFDVIDGWANGTDLKFNSCQFRKNGGTDPGTVIGFVNVAGGSTGNTIELHNCGFNAVGLGVWGPQVTITTEDMGDNDKTTGGDLSVGGDLGVTGSLTANGGGALGGTFTGNPAFTGIPEFEEIKITRDKTGDLISQSDHEVTTQIFAIGQDAENYGYVRMTYLQFIPSAGYPATPVEGMAIYKSDTHKLMVFDGTDWQACW